jgi:hypothetical protein
MPLTTSLQTFSLKRSGCVQLQVQHMQDTGVRGDASQASTAAWRCTTGARVGAARVNGPKKFLGPLRVFQKIYIKKFLGAIYTRWAVCSASVTAFTLIKLRFVF